jgi:hypothetical protein
MILLTGSEAATTSTYASLLTAARDGTIPLATLQASYARIAALKASLQGPVADTTAPVTVGPESRLDARSTLGTATVPVRTTWSAADPCRISAFATRRQSNGGSWATQSLPSVRSTSLTQSLAFGTAYRYVAKATDGAGNVGGYAYGPAFRPVVRQSSSSLVVVHGTWKTASTTGYSAGTTRYSLSPGASASYTFTGSGVGWVTAIGPTRGSARVYVDGAYATTISLYSRTTALRQIAYAANWPSQGTHTIRIEVVGTAGHPRVDVDAFVRLSHA